MTSSLKQKTASGLFWGGLSSSIQQVMSLVLGIFLARILSPEDYGLVGMLAVFVGISATIINSGFAVALTNKKDASQEDYDAVFWFTVIVGIVLYIILYFCSPLIAAFYNRPELTAISKVLFIGYVISGIGIAPATFMFKNLMVKQTAVVNMSALFISGMISVTLALCGYGYWALVIQTVLHVSLISLFSCFVSPWRPTFNIGFSPLREFLPFSIKLFFTSIFAQINANILSVLFGKMYTAVQLGYYSQGQKWMVMGHFSIGGMINSIAQPVLVQINEDRERQLNSLRKMIRFGAFVSFPVMLGLAFVGREFILLTVGYKWLPSIPYLQLFCIWGAVAYLWTLFYNVLFSHGKSNTYMYITIITGILQLIVVLCMYKFISGYGEWENILQLAVVTIANKVGILLIVVSYLVINFISIWLGQYQMRKLVGLRFVELMRDILPYLSITIACLLVAYIATKNIENLYWLLGAKIIITAALYIIVMLISRSVIFKESMEFILKRKNN